jgi:protein SCO1
MAITPVTQRGARQERLPRILLWGMLGVVLSGVVGLGVWSLMWDEPRGQSLTGASPTDLPVYGSVPDFALVDQHGRPVRRGNLEGKVWVANFVFTQCPDECPLMTLEMARLQSDLTQVADFRLVSISVDPERDTPRVLSQYAERFKADADRWFFLTGDKRAIYHLAREGFRLGIVGPDEPDRSPPVKGVSPSTSRSSADRPAPSSVGWTADWPWRLRAWLRPIETAPAFANHGRATDPLHSTRFVLVDRTAQIRGYYDSREEAALQRLRQHLQILFRDG